MQRLLVRFSGRVQGVGFRMTAQAVARDLGLTGWVRNESDGSVLMQIQGPEDAVARCLTLIPQKTFGRVDEAPRSPMPIESGEAGFEIRH